MHYLEEFMHHLDKISLLLRQRSLIFYTAGTELLIVYAAYILCTVIVNVERALKTVDTASSRTERRDTAISHKAFLLMTERANSW